MTQTVTMLIIGIVVLGLLVFIHELGHFLVAKKAGVRVLSFSIGFGKVLLAKKFKGTEYRISLIPFGGYVHMAGEYPSDEHTGEPGDFYTKPVRWRAAIAIAGPLANFLFAIFVLYIFFLIPSQRAVLLDSTVIGTVAADSRADSAGLQPGDSIVAINGDPVSNWDQINRHISKIHETYTFEFVRNGKTRQTQLTIPPIKGRDIPSEPLVGISGWPDQPSVVGQAVEGMPAQRAGLQAGDTILAINEYVVRTFSQISHAISQATSQSDEPLEVSLKRADSVFSVELHPERSSSDQRLIIGIQAQPQENLQMKTVRYGPVEAFNQSIKESGHMIAETFNVIIKLFSGRVHVDQLSGPIGIVQMTGGIAFMGLGPLLKFIAFISINLALLNLLPLIITDGGMLLFLLIEAIRGKPLPLKQQEFINRLAISFFLVLFLFVTFNDLSRFKQLINFWQ